MKKGFLLAGCVATVIAATIVCTLVIVGSFNHSPDLPVEAPQNNTTTTTYSSGNYWDQVVADFEAKKTTTAVRNTTTPATKTMADDFNAGWVSVDFSNLQTKGYVSVKVPLRDNNKTDEWAKSSYIYI